MLNKKKRKIIRTQEQKTYCALCEPIQYLKQNKIETVEWT